MSTPDTPPFALLPCPFCGEQPNVDCSEDHFLGEAGDSWLVCCGSPFCYGNAFKLDNTFHTKAYACEEWNRRAAPPASRLDEPRTGVGDVVEWLNERSDDIMGASSNTRLRYRQAAAEITRLRGLVQLHKNYAHMMQEQRSKIAEYCHVLEKQIAALNPPTA